jgi:DNA polymerase-3 subunit delta'
MSDATMLAARPAHAYLLVGPRGSGAEELARDLAAALVAPDDERAFALIHRGLHPDVVEFEPVARTYSVRDDVRPRILPEAHRSPIEGERKVLVLYEADRLEDAANALLKTLEEPPARTHFVLVASSPDLVLETVRSRCRRIDVDPPSTPAIVEALVTAGIDPEAAPLLAQLSGNRRGRANALAGRLHGVREAFATAPGALDGTGASVAQQAQLLNDAVAASLAELEEEQARDSDTLETELESAGHPERTVRAQRRRLEERHKRAARRARADAWVEGITAIESVYFDALAGDSVRNADRAPLRVGAGDATRALDACRAAREAFEYNPSEGLLVEALLLQLPAGTT